MHYCPVVIEGEHWEGCAMEKGTEYKKAMMRCRKCKKVAYCGRECQIGD